MILSGGGVIRFNPFIAALRVLLLALKDVNVMVDISRDFSGGLEVPVVMLR